jgi:hypothetical protein
VDSFHTLTSAGFRANGFEQLKPPLDVKVQAIHPGASEQGIVDELAAYSY